MTITSRRRAPRGLGALGYSIGALGGAIRGYELGIVASALLFAGPELGLSPVLVGLVVSAALAGAMLGALVVGPLSERYGRRAMLALAAVLFGLGALGAGIAPATGVLVTARLVLGVAVGIATATIPVYISEIAPARSRGSLSGLFQLMITIGVLSSSVVSVLLRPLEAWRWMFVIGAFPAILMLAGVFFLPESPRWLVKRGREDEARLVLASNRDPSEVDAELAEIRRATESRTRISLRTLWRTPRARRLVLTGIGLGVFQQLIGINTVTYYAPTILKNLGFGDSGAIVANLGFSILGLLATAVMVFFVVDRLGRRKPLMFGALLMAASMATVGVASGGLSSGGAGGYVAVAGLAMFQVGFALSWGGIVWVLLGEMFPLRIRGTAMGVATFMTEATSVVVSLLFPVLIEIGRGPVFFGFAVMGLLAFLLATFFVPETSKLSLEDIESTVVERS
ncbi:sugar porter family MFS transporter [Prauserella cavernicola]|uniref:Sugar porter family MFS transporter n=1 Tax=Prauserella cavernicola TaxID=2800127 RepID=A0A934V3T4_9PSEU|nr:sugar porter family MFS transporter [Prauserella cavernicola]MBK1787631.1 sugar porter family MFS transporter [Prauserella cavernicola]